MVSLILMKFFNGRYYHNFSFFTLKIISKDAQQVVFNFFFTYKVTIGTLQPLRVSVTPALYY